MVIVALLRLDSMAKCLISTGMCGLCCRIVVLPVMVPTQPAKPTSFDLRAEAVASGALVPGDVEASEILNGSCTTILTSRCAPELNKGLNAAEVDILR